MASGSGGLAAMAWSFAAHVRVRHDPARTAGGRSFECRGTVYHDQEGRKSTIIGRKSNPRRQGRNRIAGLVKLPSQLKILIAAPFMTVHFAVGLLKQEVCRLAVVGIAGCPDTAGNCKFQFIQLERFG